MDSMFHVFGIGFDDNTARYGYHAPERAYCLIPNLQRPRSRGRITLQSSDPKIQVAPGPEVQTEQQLIDYACKTHGTVFHPRGTAKMGDTSKDSMAVVDPQLRVRGVKKLRVVDASVFPLIQSVNPMLTVYAIAEKGAEMIIKDYASAHLRPRI
ncbi:hypothetical protein FALCPG4_018157 [Fusarium falciforme]